MLVVALAPILGVSQGAVAPTRLLGSLAISSVGIGTLNWPLDKVVDADAEVALRAAQALGVNLVDTAEAYGFGRSEQLVADCVTKADGSPIIATKFAPVPWRRSSDDVVDACRASAARLGVDAIDLYQIHFPDLIQPLGFLGIKDSKDETYPLARSPASHAHAHAHPRPQALSRAAHVGPQVLGRAGSLLRARTRPERGGLKLRPVAAPSRALLPRCARRAACVQPDQLLAARLQARAPHHLPRHQCRVRPDRARARSAQERPADA
mgnify:CR=1 FL=1